MIIRDIVAFSADPHASSDALPSATLGRPGTGWARRCAFAVPVLGLSALGTALAAHVTAGSLDPLRLPLLALLFLNLLYAALTGWPAVLGFLARACGRALSVRAEPSGLTRTALAMPIHEEDPKAVFAAVEAMAASVGRMGLHGVDIFVLSDTRSPDGAEAERVEFEALLARAPAGPAIRYRRRAGNAGRKVGNLADFRREWGEAYDYMVVLDADSLMGGATIGRLIGLMDANPGVGIIQTVPYPVGRETLFARIQQFATRLYGPALVEGLTFWQQSDGNYWGHNAIVRIAPFAAHCDLPTLPGREPFGGEILCHDVVEAGLMRGAGWGVWVLPQVEESYEAVPANMADFAGRERRWCQGNLQHAALLRHRGLRAVGRFHLAYGIVNYAAGPLTVALALLATLDAALGEGAASMLLSGGGTARAGLAALVAVLLWAGKLLSLGEAVADPAEAARFGGRGRLLRSAALEQAAATVAFPLMLMLYCRYVADLLRGKAVRWDPQARDDRGVGWAEAWDQFGWCAVAGAGWAVALCLYAPSLLPWMAPVAGGLLAVVPAVVASSRTGLGAGARAAGLFLTPEEIEPPRVLRAYARAMSDGASAMPDAEAGARAGEVAGACAIEASAV